MYEKLVKQLLERGEQQALRDAFDLVRADGDHDANRVLRSKVMGLLKSRGNSELEDLYWKSMLFDAPQDFDVFCRYIEKDRPADKQFYMPRRKQLYHVARSL